MSSTTTIPPTHVPCASEWPALSPSKMSSHDRHEADGDWEMLPEPQDGDAAQLQTSFERDAVSVRIVEPLRAAEMDAENCTDSSDDRIENNKPRCLKHAQSIADFRHHDTILEENDDDVEAVLIEDEDEDGVGSLASSSMVMVSGPPSVVSSASSKFSFRDAIMKEQVQWAKDLTTEQAPPKMMKKKPTFVVKPIKRCAKSTGDLRSLARITESGDHYAGEDDLHHGGIIMGDTDAELYYNQKTKGQLGRKNGRKTRPDEAKRLQIIMAKKDDQRQRQQAAASKKR